MSMLQGLQTKVPQIQKTDTQILAISVDPTSRSKTLAKRRKFTFPLLSDPKAKVIQTYHLHHEKGRPDGMNIARPAVFFIDRKGIIRKRLLTGNWRIRTRPQTFLQHANQLP